MTTTHASLAETTLDIPRHKRPAILRTAFSLTLVALSLMLLAIGILSHMGRLDLEPVLSGSMRPTFSPGDLVAGWRVPISSLHVGDVVAFSPPGQNSRFAKREMHRIVSLRILHGQTQVSTRGDANHGHTDPWGRITLKGPYTYRLIAIVPKLGFISQLPRGILLLVCMASAGLLLIFSALRSLFRSEPEREEKPTNQLTLFDSANSSTAEHTEVHHA